MNASEREKEGKRVQAIVLNYNGGEEVLETIASLLAGSVRPEILVVDNASTDHSRERIAEAFPSVTLIFNKENQGFAAGMNIGLRYGLERGAHFFWLINNDAVVTRNALENLLRIATDVPKSILSPAIYTPSGKPWFLGGKISFFRMRAYHSALQKNTSNEYLTGCALLIPRQAIEQVGFLDERYFLYYEDAAYSQKARRAGFDLLVVPEAKVMHAEKSQENPKKIYWLVRSGILFFREASPWYWRPWIAIYLHLRKLKNFFECTFFPNENAHMVRQAYRDTI